MSTERHQLRITTDPHVWLERARKDVEFATLGRQRGVWTESLLLCQRAVEKILTAWLVTRGTVFRLTHRIDELYRLATGEARELAEHRAEVFWLAEFKPAQPATLHSAPRDLPAASAVDLDRALALAGVLLAWVDRQWAARDSRPGSAGKQERDA